MKAIRILHLNSLLTGGGTDDQCVKLAYGLRQLGQEVWVAGPPGRTFSKVLAELEVPYYPTPPEGPAKIRFIMAAARFIRQEQIQIVHGHHGRDIWPSIVAAKLSGQKPKIVLTRHMAKSPSSWISRRHLLSQCDALIAVSQFVAKVLREGIYEPQSPEAERRSRPPLQGDQSKIHVIYGGIETTRFRPMNALEQRLGMGLEPGHYAFAVVGGYDKPRGKGHREFLAAAAEFHKQAPSARFLIIGRGNLEEVLRADIVRLGLTGKAWLTPYYMDMPRVMNGIDCLVHPQVGTEALGLVVCEAFACGKPVIASDLDGIPEAFAVGHHGALVPPESVEALADAMRRQITQPVLDEPKRLQLHQTVEQQFSLPVMATNTLVLYHRLLAAV